MLGKLIFSSAILVASSISSEVSPCRSGFFFDLSDGELSFNESSCELDEINCVYKKADGEIKLICNGVEVSDE